MEGIEMTAWIPILVPLSRYNHYAALVAEDATSLGLEDGDTWRQEVSSSLSDRHADTASSTEASAAQDDRARAAAGLAEQIPYSERDLARIAEGQTLTTQRWARALDFCAQRPGEFFTTAEVCAGTGMRLTEWRDAPRKITRHLEGHYPNAPRFTVGRHAGSPMWPLFAWTFRGDEQVSWAADAETARRWHRIRSNDA